MGPGGRSTFGALLPVGVDLGLILPTSEKLKARRGQRMLQSNQGVPELGIGRENKYGKTVMDKQFLEKVEAVRRSSNLCGWIGSEAANDDGAQKPQDIDPIQVDLLLGKAYSDWGHISDAVAVYDKLITEHPEDFRGYLAKAKFFAPEAAKALVDRYAQR